MREPQLDGRSERAGEVVPICVHMSPWMDMLTSFSQGTRRLPVGDEADGHVVGGGR